MADPFRYSLNLLNRRLRSKDELVQALLKKKFELEEINTAIAALEEINLVDDYKFSLAWVHTRDRLAPRGKAVLRLELMQKGIPNHLIEKVLWERDEQAADQEDEQPEEVELARSIMQGKERLYSNLGPEVRKRRLMALLQRRGFSYDVIRRIL